MFQNLLWTPPQFTFHNWPQSILKLQLSKMWICSNCILHEARELLNPIQRFHNRNCWNKTKPVMFHLPEQHVKVLNWRCLDSVKSCIRSLFPCFWWWKQLYCWHTPDVMTPFPTRPNPLPVLNNSALPDVLLAEAKQTNKEVNQQFTLKRNWTKTAPSKASKLVTELNRIAWMVVWLPVSGARWEKP